MYARLMGIVFITTVSTPEWTAAGALPVRIQICKSSSWPEESLSCWRLSAVLRHRRKSYSVTGDTSGNSATGAVMCRERV